MVSVVRLNTKSIWWDELTCVLLVGFEASEFEDFDESLKQTGIVQDYQINCEKLAICVQGWPEKALVGSFIGGLEEYRTGKT